MRNLSHYSALGLLAAASVGAGMLMGALGWLQPHRPVEFSALVVLAIFTAAFARRTSASDEGPAMPPAFVVEFTSLLLFGPHPALLVTAASALTPGLADPHRPYSFARTIVNGAIAMVAIEVAGLAHQALGGAHGQSAWPMQALPIVAALGAYCFVKIVATEVVVPLCSRQPIARSWTGRVSVECPLYLIGAGLAVAFAELIDRRMWEILPVAAVPLFFLLGAYCDYMNHLGDDTRRQQVDDSLDGGVSSIDQNGRVTQWNDSLVRMLGCARETALGRPLVDALPVLGKTELPRAVAEALKDRTARTIEQLPLTSAAGARILQVKIVPVAAGVRLLWHDVTERTRAEQALKRNEERLALAAEGANDGLWEWDLRLQEFYVSSRWKAMLGLAPAVNISKPEEWLDRIHADDTAALKSALKAYLAGTTEHLQHEHRLRHEDGSYRWFLCRGVAVKGAGQRPTRIAGSLTDTTERAITQERLRSAGFLDPLTGLRNRADFVEGLGRRLDQFKERRTAGRFAVIYLDLDRFKVVNDSLGHLVGDQLLIAVSRRLESCLRQGDTLARLGGDEFAILLNTVGDELQANALAFRIQEALSAPLNIAGREVFTSASIGIAFGHVQHASPDEIMRDADTAMYHAKAHGKARHELFDADMHARTRDRLDLENDLRHAVHNNDFEVQYQPIVLLSSGMCVGFESLIRWTRNGESISPATFVPMAEELGLIEPLGTWVLQEACRTFADWQKKFPGGALDYITVNVSSRQLMQQNFLRIVEQAVDKVGMKPCDLRLEITETALMDSPNSAAEVLRQLRDFGVKIYLDDFGTGYSSLSHLHKLPVDALKIDRSFVKSLVLPDRPAIVESILALARTLNTSVVAEGIESDVQSRELERLGCTHAQGFLYSRPLTMRAAEAVLAASEPLGPKKTTPSVAAPLEPEFCYSGGPFKWPESPRVASN